MSLKMVPLPSGTGHEELSVASKSLHFDEKFEVFTALKIQVVIFWIVTLYSDVHRERTPKMEAT
jgi:hypothetical protein